MMMNRTKQEGCATGVVLALLLWWGPASAQEAERERVAVPMDTAEAILRSFAEDYREDPSLREVRFAVSLDDDAWWQVAAARSGTPSISPWKG
jgi:hypothetical protein